MTKINLAAWAAVIKPFDDRHYCGRDITVADVKAAVQAAIAEAREAGRRRGRAEVHRRATRQVLIDALTGKLTP